MPNSPRELLAGHFCVSPKKATFFFGVSDLCLHLVHEKVKMRSYRGNEADKMTILCSLILLSILIFLF